jgi:hypothetical protein
MRTSRASYEGPQLSYWRKTQALEIAEIILRAIGPAAMTNDAQWGPLSGLLEHYQRSAVVGLHLAAHRYSKSSWPGASALAVRRGNRRDDCGRSGTIMPLPSHPSCKDDIHGSGLTEAQELLKTSVADFVQREYDKNRLLALERSPTGITPVSSYARSQSSAGWEW